MPKRAKFSPYTQPTGGWGSVKSLARHSISQRVRPSVATSLIRDHNKTGGYMCTSCAWAKPGKPHMAEFCENGAKATFWDLTTKRTTPEFFSRHRVSDLRGWSDHALENEGRLTHPMRYDPGSDRYLEVTWAEAFSEIGTLLRGYDPKKVVFYASGRASLETSFMYQLIARIYGTNNLPDSSNMCHETTSVALPESIGTPVGTVLLEHFQQTDCILSFGQNVGTNAPRLLHSLQEVRERDAPVIVFNPLRERGWEAFVNPQRPGQMVTNAPTQIATQYYQPRAGSDIAVILGMAKALLEFDDAAQASGETRVLDTEFIADHTHGFDAFERQIRSTSWQDLTFASGLSRTAMTAAAQTYAQAKAAIAIYGMGLTQHKGGVETVRMLVNLLLMRGNMGREGAGICPVRGHSNVQGQRTVGIAEKVDLVPLDALAARYQFTPPREDGLNTVEVCEAIRDGGLQAFIGLGGNFARAIPDTSLMESQWQGIDLSVHIATKLNRSHLITGRVNFLLPTLVRSEIDMQQTGPQIVTMEDSTTCIHASRGKHTPASLHLLSEPTILAELALAIFGPQSSVPWAAWAADYALVRDEIAAIFPKDFHDFNARLDQPGGFPRDIPARERIWETKTGRANFHTATALHASFDPDDDPSILRLMTLRSNDQFNTTIYGEHDRLRGIHGTRNVVLMNANDRIRHGIASGGYARLTTVSDDGDTRTLGGLQVIDYDIPEGTLAAYFPECNLLIPIAQHAAESKTPAAKSIPVRVSPSEAPRA